MLYGAFIDSRILWIWVAFLLGYLGLGLLHGNDQHNRTRTKIRLGSWDPATDPNCYVKIEVPLAKVLFESSRSTNSSRRKKRREVR